MLEMVLNEMITIYDNMWLDIAIDNNISIHDKVIIFDKIIKCSEKVEKLKEGLNNE
ncbi:MAG: hypothetical protein IKI95_05070 [Clostridia bacterium]|nr:hypothetical protein [Clostridia bacterium]